MKENKYKRRKEGEEELIKEGERRKKESLLEGRRKAGRKEGRKKRRKINK